MGKNRVRVKSGKAARWAKGQSSNSNPAKNRHRTAAKSRYFQNHGGEGNNLRKTISFFPVLTWVAPLFLNLVWELKHFL